MKKSAFSLLFILALLLCLVPAKTAADTSGQCGPNLNWSFDEASGTFTVTGSGAMYDYNHGYGNDNTPWASFKGQITRIVLPESLTHIGRAAFAECTGLTTLTIPEGVTSIGSSAFYGCAKLVHISLANTVTRIDINTFMDTAFWNNAPDGLVYLDHVLLGVKNRESFSQNTVSVASGTRIIADQAFSFVLPIGKVVLPEGLTHIGSEAFYNCQALQSINFPAGLRAIGEEAFWNTPLTSVTLPEGFLSIGDGAFYYCANVAAVHLPSTIKNIGSQAFCSAPIRHVYYNGTKTMRQEIQIEAGNNELTGAVWHYSSINVDAETFPDEVFRNWVLTHLPVSGSEAAGYTMTAAQIANVTTIDCSDLGIKDLTGVTEFTALASLDCSGNALTSLRLNNDLLRTLCCSNNPLSELMIDYCSQLEVLDCSNANLSTVELRYQLKLRELICHHNSKLSGVCTLPVTMERIDCSHTNMQVIGVEEGSALVSLDCSNAFVHTLLLYAQPHLTTLNCANCAFSKLDVSEFPALTTLNCSNNALGTLDVSHNPNLQSLSCGGQRPEGQRITHGKQGYLFNVAAMAGDPTRVTMVTAGANYNSTTGRLQFAAKPESIQYLLAVGGQQMDVSFPISEVEERYLEIDQENFPDEAFRKYIGEYLSTSGDVVIGRYMSAHQIAAVTTISCPGRGIRSVKGIEHFTGLQELDVGFEEDKKVAVNQISSLDLRANVNLTKLNCSANPLTSLTLPQNPRLQSLNCSYCPFTTLSLSGLNTLVSLQCSGCQLTSLNVSGLTNLAGLDCSYNKLSSLDLGGNKALQILLCDGNRLSQLNLSKNTKLYQLSCSENVLSKLDLSSLSALEYLDCSGNAITALGVSSAKSLHYLICGDNQLSSLNVAKNTTLVYLYVNDNRLSNLDVSQNAELSDLVCDNNQIKSLVLPKSNNMNLLSCRGNQITKLDLVSVPRLTLLNCSDNPLKSLDFAQQERLSELYCSGIGLTALKLPDSILNVLDCSNNKLEKLDLSQHSWLEKLFCQGNMLTALNVQDIHPLTLLDCSSNRLTALNVSQNTNLQGLKCANNKLASMDLSKNDKLDPKACTFDGQQLPTQNLAEAGDRFACNLGALVIDPAKITVTTAGAAYDPASGIVTFAEPVASFAYKYDTDKGMMNVTVPLRSTQGTPPTITTQPQDVTVNAGENATFKVVAAGEDLTYQWYGQTPNAKAWVLLEGKTTDTLTVKGTAENNGTQYYCLVENPSGEVKSNVVTLTVKLAQPPTITGQPKDAKVKSGSKAKFTVKVKEKDVSFQWYARASANADWSALAGETKATLNVVGAKANNGTQYRCRVQNKAGGVVYSNTVTLTVTLQPPVIKTQPKSITIKSGAKGKFTVKASGKNLSYKWFSRPNADAEWSVVAGETKATLNVVGSMDKNGTQYRCVIKNADGEVTSAAVTLTVTKEIPVIKTQPKNVKVKSGSKGKFTVKASGKNLSYKWFSRPNADAEWTEIAGETKATLNIVGSMDKNGWEFCCEVQNPDGKVRSNPAKLTVTPQAPKISTQPKDVKAKVGAKATFKVKASPKNVTYQWYYRTSETGEWIKIEGATSASYSFKVAEAQFGYQYRCLVRNADGEAWSKVATLIRK